MKKTVFITMLSIGMAPCAAQLNITQLGHYDYQAARNSNLANLWGYVDGLGNEYALVGVDGDPNVPNSGGLSVVNVTDPANPTEVAFISGANSEWREVKVWNDHAYVTTEADYGLLIVDLTPLPQSNVLPSTVFHGNGWTTSHSLFIDENGRLYVNGANRGNRGSIMYDLTGDPMNPVEVGDYNIWYVHDCFARGDTLYAGHIYDGFFSIANVSDPMNPVLLGTQNTPNNFTHNCWLDDTGHHLFTTDEKPNSYVGSYDVADPTNIMALDKLQTDPGSQAIVHNTYWLNHYTVQSYYTEGVSIYDVTYPENMVEVGHYDTSPYTGSGFNGAWGVYPYLPSGNLIVSDIEGGLYILAPTYVHACWLQGHITDAATSAPVFSATVSLLTTTQGDVSQADGSYHTGWSTAGTYSVLVHAVGYVDQAVNGVVLQNGQVTTLDVALIPLNSFAFGGAVTTQGTNVPIAGAVVSISGTQQQFNVITDGSGAFNVPAMFTDTSVITIGAWGYHTTCLPVSIIDSTTADISVTLVPGYYDDFSQNLGWTADGNATTGQWTRGEPVGTTYNNQPCAPDTDVDHQCGSLAYVTGNGGGAPGDDDVDNGYVRLVSPPFDVTGMPDPWVRWYQWFFDGGGTGTPNDSLRISLTNGADTATIALAMVATPGAHTWVEHQVDIAQYITSSATMRFIAYTADVPPGHLAEAGIDDFEVLPQSPFLGVADRSTNAALMIAPNPSDGRFSVSDASHAMGWARLLDAQGREVANAVRLLNGSARFSAHVDAGVYVVRVQRDDGSSATMRVVLE